MEVYVSKKSKLPGSSLAEILKLARYEYHNIQKRTPRRAAYVRSKYFTKDKIFINNFWDHLNQKSSREKVRRLKFYSCALDTIRNAATAPQSMQNPNKVDETLHRFTAKTAQSELFSVQIKENKKTGRKDFISVFPNK